MTAPQILADIDDAESEVAGLQNAPCGELRVSASVTFGRKHIVPSVAKLLARYPLLHVQLQLEGRYVDFIGERLDLAIRIGSLADSTLVARRFTVN